LRTLALTLVLVVPFLAQAPRYRTLNDRFAQPVPATREAWAARARYIREHVLASAGLLPMPERTPLNPVVFDEIRHTDYTVAKVYFESLPGLFVTGNLYHPAGAGPFPAVLSPHGHWTNGRLEHTEVTSGPGRAIGLARQGFVVFSHDMVGYNDSRQLTHTFGGPAEYLWGLSLGGLQLWNSIRALDFLETLPFVRRDGFGVTGESGGATQSFLLAAVDDRVTVAAPVNMISLHMQGGCLCENPPGLRLDLTNVEIAASIAPRPLLMISATGDWTNETLENEYPATRRIFDLFDAGDRVRALRFNAEHNYNKDSREVMYAWMARWLQHAPDASGIAEKDFTPDRVIDLLVFYGRALPDGAVTREALVERWIASAKSQIERSDPRELATALRHALGYGAVAAAAATPLPPVRPTVLLASAQPDLAPALLAAGLDVVAVPFTAFDATAAANIKYFDTYNRTAASQRVTDIVEAVRAHPAAVLVADGDAALAAILASAVVPVRRAILDVGGFDPSSDAAFLDRLYVPGLRRAGDLQTAVRAAAGELILHDASPAFHLAGPRVENRRLTPAEIAALARK
jgi:hypothetical protein